MPTGTIPGIRFFFYAGVEFLLRDNSVTSYRHSTKYEDVESHPPTPATP
jgi:hypothetical protein